MKPLNIDNLTFTAKEIQVLSRSADSRQLLVDHYERQEEQTETDGLEVLMAVLGARRELLEAILDEAAPKLGPAELPVHLNWSKEHASFDQAQGRLFLSDPAQAVGNLRWMLNQVWWRWHSLELAMRQRRSAAPKNCDPAYLRQPRPAMPADPTRARARIIEFDRELTLTRKAPTGDDYYHILGWAIAVPDRNIRQEVLAHEQRMNIAGVVPTGEDYQAVFSIATGLVSRLEEGPSPCG